MYSFLKSYYIRQKGKIILYILMVVSSSIVTALIPYFFSNIIDYTMGKNSIQDKILIYCLLIGFIFILMSGFNVILENSIINTNNNNLRIDIINRVQKYYIDDFEKNKGTIIQVITNDIPSCINLLSIIINVLVQIISFAIIYYIMFNINHQISLLLLIFIPIYFLIFNIFSKRIEIVNKGYLEERDNLIDNTSNIMTNLRILKNTKALNNFIKAYTLNTNKIFYWFKKIGYLDFYIKTIFMVIQVAIIIYVVIFGRMLIAEGSLSVGNYVAVVMYVFNFFGPLQSIISLGVKFKSSLVSVKRVYNLFNIELEKELRNLEYNDQIKDSYETIIVKGFRNPFIKEDVDIFSMDRNGNSFILMKGNLNVILGSNGSGKTTFLNTLNKLYNPKPSTIFIDGEDICNIPLNKLRSEVGIVFQKSEFFSYNIEDYTKAIIENLSTVDEKIIRFINEKLNNLKHTENVQHLSGGQKQLLAFLFELSRNAQVIIIDEGFSNMDSATIKDCLDILYEIKDNRLVIFVTHDISLLNYEGIKFVEFESNIGVKLHEVVR